MSALKLKKDFGSFLLSFNGKKIDIYPGMIVGRGSDANLIIDDSQISRVHFTIEEDHVGGLWILDKSKNGTTVNSQKISGKCKLDHDSTILIGDTEIKYFLQSKESRPSQAHSSTFKRESKKEVSKSHLNLVKNFEEDYDQYQPAGLLKRWVALVIDGFILGFLNQIPSIVLIFFKKQILNKPIMIIGIYYFLVLAINILYYYVPMKKSGQSIGKKAMKLKVIKINDEQTFSLFNIFLRELVCKPLLGFISCFLVLLSKEKRAIHDYANSTKVIDLKKMNS
jgi:uncharacterized RDD family membrane protein YckC